MQAPETPPALTQSQKKKLQMQDIARLAGVSVSTVSRALNNSPLVNDATKVKVKALAQSLNYTIDIGAQNLRLKNNRTVAVVIPYDKKNPQHVSDPFFLTMLGYIADELTKLGYYMLVSRIDADDLNQILEPYETGRAMGIIVIGQWKHHDQLNAMIHHKPIVVWGAKLAEQTYVSVGSDNFQGGYLATEHLITQKNCQHIAFFGDKSLPEVLHRYQGYVQAHHDYQRPVQENLCIATPFSTETVPQDIQQLVSNGVPFDAIFACSDLIAMRAIKALQTLKRAVPEQVAIIGYDDISLAGYFHPALTTIKQSIEAGAQHLVAALFKLMNDQATPSVQLPVDLVLRESC